MSNQPPGIPLCPPPTTLNPVCAATAKAAWDADNLISDNAYAASKTLADTTLAARLLVWSGFTQPSGWTEARWLRRKLRLRQTAYSLFDAAMARAKDDREADYVGADTAYTESMAGCCEGNA